eukprot:gene9027-11059_t
MSSLIGPNFGKNVANYHFDSFPYENSYEEDEYQHSTYEDMVFEQKWGLPRLISSSNCGGGSSSSSNSSLGSSNSNSISSNRISSSQGFPYDSSSSQSKSLSNLSNLFSRRGSLGSKRKKISRFFSLGRLIPSRFNLLKRETFISKLPVEIIVHIVSYLSHSDILNVMLVCSEWYLVGQEEYLWKSVYQSYFQCYPNRDLILHKTENQSSNHWREIYRKAVIREKKWKGENYKESLLIGHTGTVWALHFNEQRIFTGSFDKTAKVWDYKTKKCQYTLSGHYYPVQCLDFDKEYMVTGSLDNSIRLWNLDKGVCQGILTNHAHNFDVFCLQFHQHNYLISGSSDSTVKIWNLQEIYDRDTTVQQEEQQHSEDPSIIVSPSASSSLFENAESIHSFKHDSCVTCLQSQDNILMSGGSDKVVRVWDMNTAQCINELTGHEEGIRCLQFQGNILVTGSNDTTIKLWDLRSKNGGNYSTLRGHSGSIRCLQWEGTTLVTGSNDQTIRWWNLNVGSSSSKELFSFNTSISCLKFSDNILMCGLSDSKVKITNFL